MVEQIWMYTKYNQPMDSSNNFNLRQVKVPTNSSPIFKSGYRWGVMGVPKGWLLPPRHRSAIHGKGQFQKTRQSSKHIPTRRESMKTVGPDSWFKRSRSRPWVSNSGPRAKFGPPCNFIWPLRQYQINIRAGPLVL